MISHSAPPSDPARKRSSDALMCHTNASTTASSKSVHQHSASAPRNPPDPRTVSPWSDHTSTNPAAPTVPNQSVETINVGASSRPSPRTNPLSDLPKELQAIIFGLVFDANVPLMEVTWWQTKRLFGPGPPAHEKTLGDVRLGTTSLCVGKAIHKEAIAALHTKTVRFDLHHVCMMHSSPHGEAREAWTRSVPFRSLDIHIKEMGQECDARCIVKMAKSLASDPARCKLKRVTFNQTTSDDAQHYRLLRFAVGHFKLDVEFQDIGCFTFSITRNHDAVSSSITEPKESLPALGVTFVWPVLQDAWRILSRLPRGMVAWPMQDEHPFPLQRLDKLQSRIVRVTAWSLSKYYRHLNEALDVQEDGEGELRYPRLWHEIPHTQLEVEEMTYALLCAE
ncbi:hypothetical protein LTR53_010648 [Teratosphaeriaceae sp. CCFEE 6253]|nr:hypothetical protein LTR53_010648 [Teratosphaeriaceae sp. CCFEE 6253]